MQPPSLRPVARRSVLGYLGGGALGVLAAVSRLGRPGAVRRSDAPMARRVDRGNVAPPTVRPVLSDWHATTRPVLARNLRSVGR
jgi:hypothetical protein